MNKKILIIDNDSQSTRFIKETLSPLGFEIILKKNILSAAKILKNVNILLINSSYKDIIEKKIISRNPDSFIILLSNGKKINISYTLTERIYGYLEKPIDPEKLKNTIIKVYEQISQNRENKIDYKNCSIKDFLENKLINFIGHMSKIEGANLYNIVISEVEKALLSIVMKETLGNQVKAAKILGINRNTLNKKLKEYKLI